MRRRRGRRDVGAGAEAGVSEARRLQPFERAPVFGEMLRLAPNRLLPADAQPREILEYAFDKFLAASAGIDIFDPQEQLAAVFDCQPVRAQRRKGVTKVQTPCRARREPCYNAADRLPPCAPRERQKAVDEGPYQVVSCGRHTRGCIGPACEG